MSYIKNDRLATADAKVFEILQHEFERQATHLEMIASENFTSPAVMEATGSIFTNKYAEGYPQKRYYNGCAFADEIEQLAIDRLCAIFWMHLCQRPTSFGKSSQWRGVCRFTSSR